MEPLGSADDDDDDEEDYNTFLYSIVHHSGEGLPEEMNICDQLHSSPKISTLRHTVERCVSPQPTTSYCRIEEQKACHSGTVWCHAGDIDIQRPSKKSRTLTNEVRSKRTECLTRGKKSSKEQCVIDVITIESSDTESESVVEVLDCCDSELQPHNKKTDTLITSIGNKKTYQHLKMEEESSEHELIINTDVRNTDCESVLEVKSVPTVSVGSRETEDSLGKEGGCVMQHTCTKGGRPKPKKKKKKKQNKGAKETCNLRDISDYISPKSWTKKMRHFYGNSWGGENFDVNEMRKTMSDNPAQWHVLDADFIPCHRSRYSDRRSKCNNCNSWGHVDMFCPRPKKPTVCMFCGMRGHEKWNCPTSMCLNCGRRAKKYRETCSRCVMTKKFYPCSNCNKVGHPRNVCPDIWRTYHSVTSSKELNAALSETPYKPQKDQWCSNCARRGHQIHECLSLSKQFYQSASRNPLKRKLEFRDKRKRKKKGQARSSSFVSTILL